MKILGISGSTRLGSANLTILDIAASFLPDDVEFEIFNGLQEIPLFDPSVKDEPPAFTKLKDALAASDGVLISTPEYAFGIPAVLKSALEWTVASSSFSARPTALITASTSGTKAHQSLLWVLEAIGCEMNDDTQLLIQFIRAKMDAEGRIKDEATLESIKNVVRALLFLIEKKH